jgi:hypothetical protein
MRDLEMLAYQDAWKRIQEENKKFNFPIIAFPAILNDVIDNHCCDGTVIH